MKQKITKEELTISNAQLQSEVDRLTKNSKDFREKILADLGRTLLCRPVRENYFDGNRTQTFDWPEIYARIGELLTIEKQKSYSARIEAIEGHIEAIGKVINKITDKREQD